ncbi:unnamed protein product [Lymnaea stagnalis]|uniref:Uncharacterized protein n=1 Tax=Lymnaea stagnalis TaxID=6523 RepID=A0AAV2I135_LYMST
MDAFRGCFSCNCRRKSFTKRLMPAFFQVFVVIGVWHLLKSKESPDTEAPVRSLRSADYPEPPTKCSPGDYITGNHLNLDSIMARDGSPVKSQEHSHVLNVELFVRDTEHGTLVVYPVGTQVSFSADKEGHQNVGENLVFFDDNNPEGKVVGGEENRDKHVESNYKSIENGINTDDVGEDNSNTLKGHQEVVDYDEGIALVDANPEKSSSVVGKADINLLLVKDSMLRIRPEDQKGQQVILERMEVKNNEPGFTANEGLIPPNADKIPKEILASKIFQSDPRFQQYGGGNKVLANSDQMKGFSFQGGFRSGQPQGVGNQLQLSRGGIQSPNQAPLGGQQSNAATGQLAADGLGDAVYVNGEGEPLYTDGFIDRVKKLRFEMFGKVVSGKVEASPQPTPYRLNNQERCSLLGETDIMFLINSLPQSGEQRQRIRDSFVKAAFFKPFLITHMFILGSTPSPNIQKTINHEQELYGDVVQGEFIDSSENSTLKGLMGMRWVLQFCPQAEFIMKINEDVFVDTDKLLRGLLPSVKAVVGKRSICCAFNPQGPIPRSGTNSFPKDLFPNRTVMRPYCKGYALILTRGLVSSLVAASDYMPLINFEDFYLYGVLPFVVGGVEVYDFGNKRAFHDFGIDAVNCYKEQRDKCPFVASKAFSARYTSLWESVRNRLQQTNFGWEGKKSLWNIISYRRNF